jgi:PAS domain S-box-containing protein
MDTTSYNSNRGTGAGALLQQPRHLAADPGREHRVHAVSTAFRNILLVVFLIFLFVVVQTLILWRVCHAGMRTSTSLEQQGLPTLDTLASLQENLALYRLHSYEYLFARERQRAEKAFSANTDLTQIRKELKDVKALLPDSEGGARVSKLESAVDDLDTEYHKVHEMVDSDFGAAMKEMDQNIPLRTDNVANAARELEDYGYNRSSAEANAAFGSFNWIQEYAVIFGTVNILVAFGAVVFVILAARRSSAQLAEALASLDSRTEELELANNALHGEVLERQRAVETLRDSEERFSGAFEHAPIGIALTGLDGSVIKVNHAFCDLFGYTEAEWHGRAWKDITYQDDIDISLEHLRRLLAGETRACQIEKRYFNANGDIITALTNISLVRDAQRQPLHFIAQIQDISERKRAEVELEYAHRRLLDLSRKAGMAEVATNVLHNVGNVLNSVNTSATMMIESMRKSKRIHLGQVAAMLGEHSADLGAFLTNDAKGRRLPDFIRVLNETLAQEQESAVKELDSLSRNINHIKEIVSKQQSYAKVSGVSEIVEVADLVEDALQMNAAGLARHEVELIRDYCKVPPINVDKHKVLQVLINLIRNAKYACDDGGQASKKMIVKVNGADGRIRIAVSDNGIGILPENLTRIFAHGFTTRKNGHGFGLHSGALAAKEMGGSLTAQSDGLGHGATFTLDIPVRTN